MLPVIAAALAGFALGTATAWAFVKSMVLTGHEDYRGLSVTAAGGLEVFMVAVALGVLAALPAMWVSNAVAPTTATGRRS